MQTLTLSITGWATTVIETNGTTTTATPVDKTLEDYQAEGWQVVGSTKIDGRRIVELERE